MRSLRVFLLICIAALALSGCTAFPRSGDVHAVAPSDEQKGPVGLVARPPVNNASAQQIVDGFLDATAAGFDDNFAVARQYLTGEVATSWNPLEEIHIYSDAQNLQTKTTDTGAFRVSVSAVATLSSEGIYSATANEATVTGEFSLIKNSQGQWRIVALDNGIFLSEHLFTELFIEVPVYFLSQDHKYLVPDTHWFTRRSFATQAVRSLLAGPSSWLLNGVATAFPDNTQLVSSVEVESGVAHISLSSDALTATAQERTLMFAQLSRTLSSSSAIHDIHVDVQGVALGSEGALDLPVYPYGTSALSVIADGLPSQLNDGVVTHVLEDTQLASQGISDLAVSYDENPEYAAVSQDRKTLWYVSSARSLSRPFSGEGIVAPSFDIYGRLWTADSRHTGALLVLEPKSGGILELRADWIKGVQLLDVAISREGTRGVVSARQGASSVLLAFSIARDPQGNPTALGEPIQVGQTIGTIYDIAWTGSGELAVLGSTSAGSDSGIYSVGIGGPVTKLSSPSMPLVSITAGRDTSSIAGLSRNGNVVARSGGAWRSVATDISSIAYPG